MKFETTIYGEVNVPIADEALLDFIALRKMRPNLRIEVWRESLNFLLPLRCVLVDDATVGTDDAFRPRLKKLGNGVRFG